MTMPFERSQPDRTRACVIICETMVRSRRSRVEISAPTGLVADRIAGLGGDVVLFSWDVQQGAPPATDDPRHSLSPSEHEVLAKVVAGATNREIAEARGVSERTVANQMASLLRKLGATSRFELIHRYAGKAE